MEHALVVDDTAPNRDFLVRLIMQAKFKTSGVATGQAALDKLYSDGNPIRLAVVDMELPDMNGLQLTMRVREAHAEALIIVATMHDDHSLMVKAFEAGANIFLVKPHGFMELFRRITTNDLSELREQGPMVIDQYGPRPFYFSNVR